MRERRYPYKKTEKKWQKLWEEKKIFSAEDFSEKPKFYLLIEFPYPSGEGLHVGHPRSYTALDIVARKKRMQGYNVLYPIGFDSFGLPAENYAIKTGTHPKVTTKKNIKNFTRQLKSLGFSFDWSRVLSTADPEYYRWTQWIFLQFFKHGMAYKARIPINWCTSCKIGLANEEVVEGKCERCGSGVERREKEQWMLRITDYAERLISDLDSVEYLEKIKIQQKNWVGRSEGASIQFNVKCQMSNVKCSPLEVFTTRPDTIFGAMFMVVAPEHNLITDYPSALPLGLELGAERSSGPRGGLPFGLELRAERRITNYNEVKEYVEKAKRKSDIERTELAREKTGIELKGIKAVNPANGKEIPIFVADYVLLSYGTGAIMGVPAHDQRDFEFAKKYHLPITEVIQPLTPALSRFGRGSKGEGGAYVELNGKLVNSGEFSGLSVQDGIKKITEWLAKKKFGAKTIQYKLRDWVFSRQRYWGEPIPLVYCETCSARAQKAILIHGFEGSGDSNWFLWMKKKLEEIGFEVFSPTLSQSAHPTLESWIQELLPYMEKLGEDDVIVGHSLGSKAALHLIERTKKRIGYLFLVASAIGEVGERNWARLEKEWKGSDIFSLRKFWEAPVDFSVIEKFVSFVHFILSDDDPYIHKKTHEKIPSHWKLELWKGFGHFQDAEIPKLFEVISRAKLTGWVPISEKDLPLKLPNVKNYVPSDTGESPLVSIPSWVKAKCPRCGGSARRETDVMPNWAGSNWYYLAYAMRGISNFSFEFEPEDSSLRVEDQFPISKYKEILKYWMPVDWYNGGMEHTTLHLLYSRFVYKFLWDIGAVPKECGSEPYKKRTSHGLILGEGGEKMSKSRGNVVNPDDIVQEFGADVFRLYEMFIGPFDQPAPWSTQGILGMKRFLDRVWKYGQKFQIQNHKQIQNSKLEVLMHQTMKKVTEDIEQMKFNTAVSSLMIYFNEIQKQEIFQKKFFETFLLLLSPFAPHIAEELWELSGNKKSIIFSPWPQYDGSIFQAEEFQIVIQVNGKVRDTMTLKTGIAEREIFEEAMKLSNIKKHVVRENVVKHIYVPQRILNIVTR